MANLKCTAPNCGKTLAPKAAWLPEVKALRRAAGKRVDLEDFPKFVLCGRHGHLLRETGVRVYRYLQTREREEAIQARRQAEAGSFATFADLFAPKEGERDQRKGGKGPRRGRDGRGVGQGLARCSKLDANKRKAKGTADQAKAGDKTSPSSSQDGPSGNGEAAE